MKFLNTGRRGQCLSTEQVVGAVVVRIAAEIDAAVGQRVVDGMMTWDRQYAIGNQFSGLPGFQRVAGGKDDFRH